MFLFLLVFIGVFLLSACSDGPVAIRATSAPALPTVVNTAAETLPEFILVAVPGSDAYLQGQRLYEERCAACHGINGEGQFPAAPAQPDATGRIGAPPHDGTGHTWHHDDDLLIRYVKEGGMGDPRRFYPMPPAPDLTDAQIHAIYGYIKTFWSMEQQLAQRQRSQAVRQQSGG